MASILIAAALVVASNAALAEQVVTLGPGPLGHALLDAPASPRASVILVPGGDGVMNIQSNGSFTGLQGNQLVRTRTAYTSYGIATLTVDRNVNLAGAVNYMRRIARPVAIVATSRGTLRAPQGLGARPNGVVLTSAFLPQVEQIVGSPARLPPTLVVANTNDQCPPTSPAYVAPFKAWGGARVSVVMLSSSGGGGRACGASSPHGFYGLDGQVVATVANFVLSLPAR